MILVILLTPMIVGCTNSDDRLVEMARENARDRPRASDRWPSCRSKSPKVPGNWPKATPRPGRTDCDAA